MELKKLGRKDEACTRFAALAAAHPDYLPTYLMGGGLLGELGRTDEAADLFARGILVARAQGNEHALGELTAAKAQLPR
jgi:hypothetical protein